MRPFPWLKAILSMTGAVVAAAAIGYWQMSRVQPAVSESFEAWARKAKPGADPGAALFAFGDFGAVDLDTLQSSSVPWAVLASSLALAEAGGDPGQVTPDHYIAAFRRFGFLFPASIAAEPSLEPARLVPLGLSVGRVERALPPLRVTAINIGCAACHANTAYHADGSPDPTVAVLGRPNTSLDLEAFTRGSYEAMKAAFADVGKLRAAMTRLFPGMTLRERLTLDWIAMPAGRQRLAELKATYDRPLPFSNGAPGLTNGVGALKHQLGLTPRDRFNDGAGFVSVPDLTHREFRSALLADGAYAAKGQPRFRPVTQAEAKTRDIRPLASIASLFLVTTTGQSPARAEAAIPDLVSVLAYLRANPPPRFPGTIDRRLVTTGRDVYTRTCAGCHGSYDASIETPALLSFPNWAGDVGTDTSRRDAFTPALKAAVDGTGHGQRLIDAATTGRTAAQILSGVWATAPYFVNGSVPTLRHLLEPQTRPAKFMSGGHRLSFELVGIDGALDGAGVWSYPEGYRPFSRPAMFDTSRPGFSNRGHEAEVTGLTGAERDALLEYLKLL